MVKVTDAKYSGSGGGASIDNIKFAIPINHVWEAIVPLVCDITNQVACKYLFAAAQTADEEVKKLVQYYKNELKFSDCIL